MESSTDEIQDNQIEQMNVKQLKEYIISSGLKHDGCLEKSDLIQRAREAEVHATEKSAKKKSKLKQKDSQSRPTRATKSHPSYNPQHILIQAPWLGQFPLIKPEHRPQLPYFVEQMVQRNFEDFTWATDFDPFFLVDLMRHGFLTMATEATKGLAVLLPKLHKERCLLKFQDMIIQRGTRKRAKHFSLTVNTEFDQVVSGIRKQHGKDCWFYPSLVDSFFEIFGNPEKFDEEGKPKVRIHSFELWEHIKSDQNESTNNSTAAASEAASGGGVGSSSGNSVGRLVAGELGYSVGLVYTSLSGFSTQSSAGSVQMAVTGLLLQQRKSPFWDLGMALPYKMGLGAKNVPRKKFVVMLNLSKVQQQECLEFGEYCEHQSAHNILKEFKSQEPKTTSAESLSKKTSKKTSKESTSAAAAAEPSIAPPPLVEEPSCPPPPMVEPAGMPPPPCDDMFESGAMSDSGNMSEN